MRAPPSKRVDEYLAKLPAKQRRVLQEMRETIQVTAKELTEGTRRGLPAYRLDGRLLVTFEAGPSYCSLHVMSNSLLDDFEDDLFEYPNGRGTIQFTPSFPLPHIVVRRLVWARVIQTRQAAEERAKRKKAREAGKPLPRKPRRPRYRQDTEIVTVPIQILEPEPSPKKKKPKKKAKKTRPARRARKKA